MTTYTGTQKGTAQHNTSESGNAWRDANSVTVTANLTTADAVVLMDVPAGVRLETLRYRNGDLDTGTASLTMNIGYRTKLPGGSASSATYFASASTSFQAANATWQELVFNPVKFDEPVELVMVPAANGNALSSAATVHVQAEGTIFGIV